MNNLTRIGWVLVCAALLTACASTDRRIRKNADYFATLTPEQQRLIREGRVAVGFDQKMVYLAVGNPDQRWSHSDENGEAEIWSFTTYESTDRSMPYTGLYQRHYYDFYPAVDVVPGTRTREYFKVTFREGKVVLVEQEYR